MIARKKPSALAVVCLLAGAVSAADAATLTIEWDPPSDSVTAGYVVWFGTTPGAYTNHIDVGMVTRHQVDGLADGVTYHFAVQAYSASGHLGQYSAEVAARAGGAGSTLGAPRALTAALRANRSVDLSWLPPDRGAPSYRIEIGSAPGRTDLSGAAVGLAASFSLADLPANTYYVRVRAVTASGVSSPSNEVAIANPETGTAPRALRSELLAGGVLRLAWDPPVHASGVSGYLLEAGTASGQSNVAQVILPGLMLMSPAPASGTYYVRVRALAAAGAGPASNEVVVRMAASGPCTQPPGTPRLTADVVGGLVQISWSAGTGEAATGYLLDVGSRAGSNDIASLRLGAEARTLTAFAPAGTYALRLTAFNGCGASLWAPEATVMVGGSAVVVPGAPSRLAQQVSGRTLTLTWSAPATGGPVTGYLLEVLTPAGQLLANVYTGTSETSFSQGGVPSGSYTVRVRAINAAGIGAPSNTVTAVVP